MSCSYLNVNRKMKFLAWLKSFFSNYAIANSGSNFKPQKCLKIDKHVSINQSQSSYCLAKMESLGGGRENNFKRAITEMRAHHELFPRVFKLTLKAEGNRNSSKTPPFNNFDWTKSSSCAIPKVQVSFLETLPYKRRLFKHDFLRSNTVKSHFISAYSQSTVQKKHL